MNDWQQEMEDALTTFITVAELAGESISMSEMEIEFRPAPHKQPTCLPVGKMAVYAFWWNGEWLKIGKVGPNSGPRYVSQHYTGSAMSTLSGSLSNDPRMARIIAFDHNNLKEWIKKSTCRVNILLSAEKPKVLLTLLEAFLHARLNPRYEG